MYATKYARSRRSHSRRRDCIWTVASRMSSHSANHTALKDVLQGFPVVLRHVFAACAVVTRLPAAVRVDSVNASLILLTEVDLRLRAALRGRELPVGKAVVNEVEVRAEHRTPIANRNPNIVKMNWV